MGSHGLRIVWVAGPPFTAELLRPCAARAGGELVPLLASGVANDLEAVAGRLCRAVDGRAASGVHGGSVAGPPTGSGAHAGPRVVLVAHGLAVPAAVRAAALLGSGGPLAGLVLSNGPITRLDPVSAAFGRAGPGLLLEGAPGGWIVRALASSAGLRRAVMNPYVMDRDTVAAIAGPLFATRADRAAVVAYLRSLQPLPEWTPAGVPTLLAWGDEDRLYPLAEADAADARVGGRSLRAIPGGRFVHPEERPWALADLVTAFCVDRFPAPGS